MKKIISSVLFLCGCAPSAWSAQVSGKLDTTMSIPVMCNVTSVSNVDFGAYTGAANRDAVMTVGLRCTRTASGTPVKIMVDCGQNGVLTNNVCARKMKNATTPDSLLDYKLFFNSAYTSELTADGVGTTYSAAGTAMNIVLYPRLPLGQYTAKYGNYADEVTVSLTF